MPGREWIRRGIGDAEAVSRSATQFDLGRFGERDRAGRAAGGCEGAEALDRVMEEIRMANDPRVEKFVSGIRAEVVESEARRFTERIAIALQASLSIRFSPAAISDAFCASRIEGDAGRAFGTLPRGVDFQAVMRG